MNVFVLLHIFLACVKVGFKLDRSTQEEFNEDQLTSRTFNVETHKIESVL